MYRLWAESVFVWWQGGGAKCLGQVHRCGPR